MFKHCCLKVFQLLLKFHSGPRMSRPITPVQSDTEFEVSQREKVENVMTHSASWKWGELPTHEEKTDNTSSAEGTYFFQ
jgi:hypothetical protein